MASALRGMIGAIALLLATSSCPGRFHRPAARTLALGAASCALQDGGEIYCWGDIRLPGSASYRQNVATYVTTIEGAAEIALGPDGVCARRASGPIMCVPIFAYSSQAPSVDPFELTGVDDAVEIAGTLGMLCAVRATGDAVCWTREMGWTPFENAGAAAPPRITDVVEIAGGPRHACVRTRSGAVWCRGENSAGQLGDGREGHAPYVPVRVLNLDTVDQLTAGSSHTCARQAGRVLCWGSNVRGQIGDGVLTTPRRVPSAVTGLDDAVDVVARGEFSCARRASGAVVCWGDSTQGQLGDGVSAAFQPTPVSVAGLTDAVELGAGDLDACARRVDRTIACWGFNLGGQLGDGTFIPRRRPTAVLGLP